MFIMFFLISFLASVIGAVCGIGGGIIIKPVLDAYGGLSVSTINFLSGCTVLSMSCYPVMKAKSSKESGNDLGTSTYLGLGAIIGGIFGKQAFEAAARFLDENEVGVIQAVMLLIITLGTLLYSIYKSKIKTRNITNKFIFCLIGLALGIISLFLGIGGGPVNLVVLYYFFSMETKTAAQNSLYIILLSQISSLVNTLLTGTVPDFSFFMLGGMVICGIMGGVAGGFINKKIDSYIVDKLFAGLMILIVFICIYNIFQFM